MISASRRVRNTGAVPVFGLTAFKVGRRQCDSVGLCFVSILLEEGAIGKQKAAIRTAEDQRGEFETGINVREERPKFHACAPVLEIEQRR